MKVYSLNYSPAYFGSTKKTDFAQQQRNDRVDTPKTVPIPLNVGKPPSCIQKNTNEDIEKLLGQKIVKSEVIDRHYGKSGKLTVENITLEDGTILGKRTAYNLTKGCELHGIMLEYKTNIPDDYPYLKFEYSEEYNPMPGYCFVRYINKNHEQGHGVCLETDLR